MFTGLIRELATVKSLQNAILSLHSNYRPKLGDSIAINGVCLSVVSLESDGFSVELSAETQKVVALERFKGEVHIEPAMVMGERFEGHIVQGHVDTIGSVESVKKLDNGYDVIIAIEPKFIRYVVPKGSITIDGVSLTVNDVAKEHFRLTIIPITMRETLFKTYKKGTRVNIETDMFARYIEHLLAHRQSEKTTSWEDIDRISVLY